jgi:hypothetical protein
MPNRALWARARIGPNPVVCVAGSCGLMLFDGIRLARNMGLNLQSGAFCRRQIHSCVDTEMHLENSPGWE